VAFEETPQQEELHIN